MKQYVELINRILQEGEERQDRTGVGTTSVFNHNMTFDLRERFPLVTVKETRWKTAFLEMLFFLTGETNIRWLNERGSTLWDAWADPNGELGPVYGFNWRKWEGKGSERLHRIDQIRDLIYNLKENPQSRRHIVTAWNVGDLEYMALPPCHWAHQVYCSNDGHLDMTLFMRSSDVALGLPFNIAQYALLLHLYARATGYTPRYLHVHLGDAHLYRDHIEPMKAVAHNRAIECPTQLVFKTDNTDIDGYKLEDFDILGYNSHPFVKMKVAV